MATESSKHTALTQFPRTSDLTSQSPKYWAKEKDRYLRQLLILDIEALTGRPLVVYFSQLDQEINHADPDDLAEIIQAIDGKSIDLFIQTPGGSVDACERQKQHCGNAVYLSGDGAEWIKHRRPHDR